MLITIPDVLTAAQVAHARQTLSSAEWVDGRVTAGHQSAQAKDNLQIPEGHPAALEIGDMILTALGQDPLFISAALPMKVFPPLFNSYGGGQSFGTHVDNADHQDVAIAEQWAARIPAPTYAIDDQTAIKVTDGNVEVVSEGHWRLFTP